VKLPNQRLGAFNVRKMKVLLKFLPSSPTESQGFRQKGIVKLIKALSVLLKFIFSPPLPCKRKSEALRPKVGASNAGSIVRVSKFEAVQENKGFTLGLRPQTPENNRFSLC
jgi:hypothetical protein